MLQSKRRPTKDVFNTKSDSWLMLLENILIEVGSTTELVLFDSLASKRSWFEKDLTGQIGKSDAQG